MLTAAAIALIFLIIESLGVVLVFLLLFGGMVYGMIKLRQLIKRVLPRIQGYSDQAYTFVHMICDKIAEPFLWIRATEANLRTTLKSARRRVGV